MVKITGIQKCKDNYQVIQVCGILKFKTHPIDDDLLQMIASTFDDVELNFDTKDFNIIQSTANYDCLSNKDKVALILKEFRKLLPFGSVTIIEQRLPIKSVKYELTE